MAFSRLELKIISIVQLVMSVILFAFGIVDHFEVRYIYLSHLLMPCWIAALVCTLAQDTQLRMFYCLRSCFWQLKYEKFEVHGEDVKLLLAGASLRFNNPTTETKFHTTLTAAFHLNIRLVQYQFRHSNDSECNKEHSR